MASVEYEHIETIWGAGQGITFDFDKYAYHVKNPNQGVVLLNRWNGTSYEGSLQVGSYSIVHLSIGIINMGPGYNLLESVGGPLQLYRRIKNTAPTTPGAFTQPTGTLEIGDTKVVSWGPSSATAGGSINYYPEVSINNGSWTVIGGRSVPNVNYKIPEATTIKFRVRAQNDVGYSIYRESPVYTVSKPAYYWSKYNSDRNRVYTLKVEGVSRYTTSGYSSISQLENVMMNAGYRAKDARLYSSAHVDSDGITHITGSLTSTYISIQEAYDKYPNLVYFKGFSDGKPYYLKIEYLGPNNYKMSIYEMTTTYTDSYTRGALVQSGIQAVEGTYPTDGRHTDGYWYVRGSRVSQSIAPPSAFTAPEINTALEPKQALTLAFGASGAPSISTYEVQSRYNDGAWQNVGTHTNALTRAFTVTTDKSLKTVEFRVRAKNTSGVYSDYVYSETFTIQHNKVPTITLETENNKTLYEKDTFTIKGSALEPDIGDVLIVYYRLNGGTARGIETKLSDGSAIPFNEQLLFKSGKLYKGETEITGKLTEGTAHTLEVWAADNQGGESEIERRTFYVVPNRPPSLTIDPITDQSGLINVDKVKVTGESFDPDGNDVVVRYRINNGINVEIHSGPAGAFSFDIPLSKLKDGENSIVVEVSDTYESKYSKTVKLNKTANLTPLEQSVQRYTIVPPAGSAGGVLLWIQRDETQPVAVEISMTNGTEPEQFVPMIWNDEDTKDDPKPAPISPGIVEDFLKFRSDIPAEKIAIKLSWTGDKPILQIQGALLQ